MLLRPEGLSPDAFAWFPLLAGVAMSRALDPLVPGGVQVKWPNDVLVGDRKVCGILSELLPGMAGVVVGAGVNLTLEADELPVETATSLTLEGAEGVDADAVLSAYLIQLTALYREYLAAGGDPARSALRDQVVAACHTIGRAVRVQLPSGEALVGTAVDIDGGGRLVVESDAGRTAVAAGDVTHLRY